MGMLVSVLLWSVDAVVVLLLRDIVGVVLLILVVGGGHGRFVVIDFVVGGACA